MQLFIWIIIDGVGRGFGGKGRMVGRMVPGTPHGAWGGVGGRGGALLVSYLWACTILDALNLSLKRLPTIGAEGLTSPWVGMGLCGLGPVGMGWRA